MCAPAMIVTIRFRRSSLVVDVRRGIGVARIDYWIGEPLISALVIVLVEGDDEQAVVSFRPLIIAVKVFSQPRISRRNALRGSAVVHVMVEVWNDDCNGRQLAEGGREIRKAQVA